MWENFYRLSHLLVEPSAPKAITGGMIAPAATGQSSTIDGATLKLNGLVGCRSSRLTTSPNYTIDGNGTRPLLTVPWITAKPAFLPLELMAISASSIATTPTRPPTGPLTDTTNPAVQTLTLRVAAPSVDGPQRRSLSNAIVSVMAKGALGKGAPITTSHGAAALVVNANTLAPGTT